MAERKPVVISVKKARAQINVFGFSLIICSAVSLLVWYGSELLDPIAERYFPLLDGDTMVILMYMAVMPLMAFVLFRHTAHTLNFNYRDYLEKKDIPFWKMSALCMAGAAIAILVTAIASTNVFFLKPRTVPFTFVGQFDTTTNIWKNVMYFVVFVMIKPITDEFIFHGVVQRQLGHYSRDFGVFASALLYAMSQPTFSYAIVELFVGWYLAWIALRYHSIRPSIIAHSFVSLISWAITAFSTSVPFVISFLVTAIYAITIFGLFTGAIEYRLVKFKKLKLRLWKILFSAWTIRVFTLLFLVTMVLSFII